MSINNILIVTLGFVPESLGGTEFYSYNLAKTLAAQGKAVTVLAALNDSSAKRYQLTRSQTDGVCVIKVANSHVGMQAFTDFFIDETIDHLFADLLDEIQPDVIHFQHLFLLSANLPEIAYRQNIPAVFTLHDYWMICFRSRLLRPGVGVCSGPAAGAHCASCDDGIAPHPMAVAKYPKAIQFLHKPAIKKTALKTMELVPQAQINKIRSRLFGNRGASLGTPDQESISNNRFRYKTFKQQLKYSRVILSPSHYLKARFEQEGIENITVLPLGFDPVKPLEPMPFTDKLHIAFIGNIEPHKGAAFLLKALATATGLLDRVVVDIYGHPKDPIYSSKVKKLIQGFPKGSVRFHGPYRSDLDLRRIFTSAHLVVFPSLWEENHPLVIREALLHNRPVLASNIGGVPEIIEHGINGLLFDPFKMSDLIVKLTSVLETPNLLNILTQGAIKTPIETMNEHIYKICDIYQKAVG